ncbi:hypothetical protein SAMN03003324_00898 [Pedobacter antarcticus]|uniref:Uncharacterized protein n=1 Tax=Pedobacter antarcticus TaxID=34086 RepID=A0A1I2BIW3_9SPHI|nr:hypothetical protein [Pedobacter antarcticus]SFE56111.1 hypothetical protein SAMN03003324_00898 [Pedobacter antarcticus]
MGRVKKLTDKERIAQLEKEVVFLQAHLLIELRRLKEVIGINDDYVHEPVKELKIS